MDENADYYLPSVIILIALSQKYVDAETEDQQVLAHGFVVIIIIKTV